MIHCDYGVLDGNGTLHGGPGDDPFDRRQYPEQPLTEGELRVLHYLPTHLTAPEIAK
jgi:hypothetical protein